MRRLAPLVALLLLVGCGSTDEAPPGPGTLTIYVSAPLSGPARDDGIDLADGARLAAAQGPKTAAGNAIEIVYLDAAGRNEASTDPVVVAANARTAIRDSTTAAYLGELDPDATAISRAITDSADVLHPAFTGAASDLPVAESELVEAFRAAYGRDPGPYAALGYEQAGSVLQALESASDPTDRDAVAEAYDG